MNLVNLNKLIGELEDIRDGKSEFQFEMNNDTGSTEFGKPAECGCLSILISNMTESSSHRCLPFDLCSVIEDFISAGMDNSERIYGAHMPFHILATIIVEDAIRMLENLSESGSVRWIVGEYNDDEDFLKFDRDYLEVINEG